VASARQRLVEEPSQAFNKWHRANLPGSARMMDVDLCYYDEDGVYLVGEVIHIRRGTLEDADTESYAVWSRAAVDALIVATLTASSRWSYRTEDDELCVPVMLVWLSKRTARVSLTKVRMRFNRRLMRLEY